VLRFAGAERDRGPQTTARRAQELLADFLANVKGGIEFNNHVEGSRPARGFRSRCKRGHDGIVAKRKDLPYESGRSKR
jgi:ATP-dependent DNA ligase